MELNDEMLCAFIDDELDAETRATLEQMLAGDQRVQLRLAQLRSVDARIREALPTATSADGNSLAEFILNARPIAAVASRQHRGMSRRRTLFAALAAGLCGIVIGHLLRLNNASNTAGHSLAIVADAALMKVLESSPGGIEQSSEAVSTRVLLSFRAGNGHYCRVFERQHDGAAEEGVACRSNDRWQVVAFDRTMPSGEGFRAAGASGLIDAAMDHLGGSAALDVSEERALIEGNWAPPTPQ